ncbi:TetR/AcrR family transcriptional regulator [Mycolicibacterium smegmatis]|uniref:Transcriptional regulator n=4 Tax=Mycolicibacterium smegmatis TaxID=1772 RepID=A0QST7_MYCS2|nr:TetR/AcrR family transcriptional regulator [Mycolicibacterium smegmatis]ABK75403.1 transcriptional regulator [Mycolicibacterium smegmatis MC2 155]AFP38030.1 Transcriptional regulator, TetR family [Mycolicibacterium smegmatis MC2 155]AIU06826.1 TetR family transcriptional regulator [Mycolicibacterium smegmatis MC2 155]AIU13451.1 TetR family transcriptional regulator [Mycolicibacterium smegmatis]AIU20075.1 TetR family transcriptional regulator [Mycolicibacterium smegmatis]
MTETPVRRRRADAQRNRDAILRAAREAFETDGIFAPLDSIATAAGVGNATLYRNFPTRDDLLRAVLEDGVAEMVAESEAYERHSDAEEALRDWLFRVTWALRIWHDLPNCIATAHDDAESPVRPVTDRMTDRTARLLDNYRAGKGPSPVTAEELFQLVTAVSWAVDRFGDDRDRARRRLEFATSGLFDS